MSNDIKVPRLQAMFDDLTAKKEALLKKLEPVRADYERLVNEPRLIECKKIIKEASKELGPIEAELAVLAKGMGARGLKIESGRITDGRSN